MPRGSKPGERRGGRQRATPNRRTVLTNTILAAAAANPTATVYNLVLILAKDQALAADTRMAIARKALLFGPSRSMHNRAAAANGHGKPSSEMGTRIGPDHEANKRTAPKRSGAIAAKAGLATDLLFAVAQDIAAAPADRRKAASQVAEFFLPKSARGTNVRRGKFPPDEYGFVVDPKLATELRDSKLKLACLNLAKHHTPYAIAQKARTLNARIEEIQRSLQCPCPSRYGRKQLKNDNERLEIFADRRARRKLFPPEEDLEEARRAARFDSFRKGPEVMARQRLADLRKKTRVADTGGPPLTAAQETTFRFLALLYPSRPRQTPSEEMIERHPFSTEWPYPYIVGNPNYPEPES